MHSIDTYMYVEYLVLASCCETSKRVLICSETTPTARKPTHARPAPMPNRLVRVEAIQSVDSALVLGLLGLCSATLLVATDGGDGGSAEFALSWAGFCGCGGRPALEGCGVGGCEDEK